MDAFFFLEIIVGLFKYSKNLMGQVVGIHPGKLLLRKSMKILLWCLTK